MSELFPNANANDDTRVEIIKGLSQWELAELELKYRELTARYDQQKAQLDQTASELELIDEALYIKTQGYHSNHSYRHQN